MYSSITTSPFLEFNLLYSKATFIFDKSSTKKIPRLPELSAGLVINLPLKLDLSGYGAKKDEDISSSNVAFGISYLRKMNKHLWLGGDLMIGMLSKNKFDPNATTHIETSGQVYNIDLKANYYLNPQSTTRFYLQAGTGFASVNVNKNLNTYDGSKWIQEDTKTVASSNISAIAGLGVERSIADLNLGLEFKARYNTYSGDLKTSSNLSYLISAKINWFF